MPFLNHIDIHSKVTRICKYAFWNCLSLAQNIIPSSVTAIEKYAFEGCSSSFKEVMISNKQTKINYDAFYQCKLLKNLPYYPDGTKVKGILIFLLIKGWILINSKILVLWYPEWCFIFKLI